MKQSQKLTTTNPGHGFHGTRIAQRPWTKEAAADDFDEAARAIVEAFKVSEAHAVAFLDSGFGRCLADSRRPDEGARACVLRIAAEPRWRLRQQVAQVVKWELRG